MTEWPWDYRDRPPFPYDDERAYAEGMARLVDCETVEDWGCGAAWAKHYRVGHYRGVDLAPGYADVIADLRYYTSDVDGIFMRGVLEHNEDWRSILDNALASARKRLVLVMFGPREQLRRLIDRRSDGIPTYSYVPEDIEARFAGRPFLSVDWQTETQFRYERMYVVDGHA